MATHLSVLQPNLSAAAKLRGKLKTAKMAALEKNEFHRRAEHFLSDAELEQLRKGKVGVLLTGLVSHSCPTCGVLAHLCTRSLLTLSDPTPCR